MKGNRGIKDKWQPLDKLSYQNQCGKKAFKVICVLHRSYPKQKYTPIITQKVILFMLPGRFL